MEHIIIKYINKEISEEELEILKEGLKNPVIRKQLEDYLDLESSIQLSLKDIDLDRTYERLETGLQNNPKVKTLHPKRKFLKYAAAIVILIALGTTGVQLFFKPTATKFTPDQTTITLKLEDGSVQEFEEEELVISAGDYISEKNQVTPNTPTTISYNEINVPYGKKATIRLSDSSQVVLNSGSIFKYPSSFKNQDLREVSLEGEAYFSISKNASKPFIVQTKKMDVEVLGTEFNLSCFNDDNHTMAVLIEGSISARNVSNDRSVIIKPGQAAAVNNDSISVSKVDIQKHTAWLHGDLLFIDDTFETVLKKLERHYNVVIINNNPSLNLVRYNGRFNTETVEQVLEAFKINTSFEYKIEQNQIIIKNQVPMK